MSRAVCLSIATAVAVGCSSDRVGAPPPGLPYATATPTCAPNDGPAVSIYLTALLEDTLEPSKPYVRIAVWQPLDSLVGRSWVLAPSSEDGSAWYHATAVDFESATNGRLTVTSFSLERVRGTVDVTFPDAGRIRGAFEATWIPQAELCG